MLCFNINSFYSQSTTLKSQLYTENLDLFSGNWEYNYGNVIFRIVLKIGADESDSNFGTCLIGDYFYSKNGFVMDNYNEAEIPTSYTDANYNSIIIFASNGNVNAKWVRPNILYVFFKDKRTNSKTFSGSIELISPTQIHWVLKGDEGVYDNEEISKGFSVPTDVIMNKK